MVLHCKFCNRVLYVNIHNLIREDFICPACGKCNIIKEWKILQRKMKIDKITKNFFKLNYNV